MERKVNLGKAKAILDRQRNYLGLVQSMMIAFLFFKEVGWNDLYLLGLLLWPVFIYFDFKYVWQSEVNFIQRRSSAFRKILEKL